MDFSNEISCMLEEKALELFKLCDTDGKGYLTRADFTNLNTDLQLGEEAINQVFESLSERGPNGTDIISKEKFILGFGTFFRCAGRRLSVLAAHDLPHNLKNLGSRGSESHDRESTSCDTPYEYSSSDVKRIPDDCESGVGSSGGTVMQLRSPSVCYEIDSSDWDPAFTEMLSQLSANGIEPQEDGFAELWQRLEREDPFMLPMFERFLRKVTGELTQTKSYCQSLASLLRKKVAEHDETITTMHDDLEDQVRQEAERICAQVRAHEASERRLLERELAEREERQSELRTRLCSLEERERELSRLVESSKLEAEQLLAEKEALESELASKTACETDSYAMHDRMKTIQQDLLVNEKHFTTEVGRLQAERDALQNELREMTKRNSQLRSERHALTAPMVISSPSMESVFQQRQRSLHRYPSSSTSISSFSIPSVGCNKCHHHQNRCCSSNGCYESDTTLHSRLTSSCEDGSCLNKCGPPKGYDSSRSMETLAPNTRTSSMETLNAIPTPLSVPRKNSKSPESLDGPPLFKVVFLGDSGVGKTAVLHRLCYDQFRPTFNATIGMDLHLYPVHINDENLVNLQLWDTAGQERYRSMTRQYFRNADAFVLVYDILCEASFLSCRWWLEEIDNSSAANTVHQTLLLLGNKCDKASQGRVVSLEQAKLLAMERGMMFAEVSAQTGFGVHEVIGQLAIHFTRNINMRTRKSIRGEASCQTQADLIKSLNGDAEKKEKRGCCN